MNGPREPLSIGFWASKVSASAGIPEQVTLRWPQHRLQANVLKMFPQHMVDGAKFPMLEDLVNSAPFVSFLDWLDARGLDSGALQPPGWQLINDKARSGIAQGLQLGAHTAKRAMPALIDPRLSPMQHFDAAVSIGSAGRLPWHGEVHADTDLRFAASQTAVHAANLREFRQSTGRALRELSCLAVANLCPLICAPISINPSRKWPGPSTSR